MTEKSVLPLSKVPGVHSAMHFTGINKQFNMCPYNQIWLPFYSSIGIDGDFFKIGKKSNKIKPQKGKIRYSYP